MEPKHFSRKIVEQKHIFAVIKSPKILSNTSQTNPCLCLILLQALMSCLIVSWAWQWKFLLKGWSPCFLQQSSFGWDNEAAKCDSSCVRIVGHTSERTCAPHVKENEETFVTCWGCSLGRLSVFWMKMWSRPYDAKTTLFYVSKL